MDPRLFMRVFVTLIALFTFLYFVKKKNNFWITLIFGSQLVATTINIFAFIASSAPCVLFCETVCYVVLAYTHMIAFYVFTKKVQMDNSS